jgi:hypothetical protein
VPAVQKLLLNIKVVPFCHNEICQVYAILRNRREIAGITLAVFDRPVDAANHADQLSRCNTSPDDKPSIKHEAQADSDQSD